MTRSTGAAAPAFLALACVGFVASAPVHAANGPDTKTPAAAEDDQDRGAQDRDQITVNGQVYQPKQQSPKNTRSVRDTPQTVTVITGETIEQQNLLTLRDMLSTVPGITFGAAEGGTPPSDQINFRGYSAGSDITQDGVRDSAAYSRSDSFNLEQLEVVNGANSVYSGAGSVGGSINIVTKRPLAEDRIVVSAGVGTPEYYRGTVDANVRVNDLIAVRLNAMAHQNDIPGRDVEYNKRWGVAPAITLGIGGPTRLTLQYLHQEDNNIPQYGVPYYKNGVQNGILPGVDRENYYGYRNVDRQDIVVDQATITFEHDISDKVSVRNLARWQKVNQVTVVGPPQGTWCLASGVTPTGAACPANVPAGYYLIGGPRGTYRDSTNELMYDQIDLRSVFDTGGIEHTVVVGASTTWEKYHLVNGNALRTATGGTVYTVYPLVNIANPYDVITGPALPAGTVYGSNYYTGPVNLIATANSTGEINNYALYAFDTMKIGKLELNGGIRWESNSGMSVGTLPATPIRTSAKLFSYRAGVNYKPVEAVSIYAAYGNSKTPSQSAVNGSCTFAGVNGATATTCVTKPESAKNYEVGIKAELAGGRLLLTAAAFRNERDSYRVPSNEPGIPDQQMDGASRVDGLALGAVGKITHAWTINANYTYLKSKLLQSVSNYCLANPGTTGCGNNATFRDPAAGAELQNTPKHSGSLFTTYQLPFGLRLGYGVTYQGSFALNLPAIGTPTTTLTRVYRSDDYWVHNAYLAYDVSKQLSLQLNVKNIGDTLYYTRIRNNGWATPGDGRAAILTLNYKM